MNVEDFRNHCLGLPGVTEGTPFEKFSRGKYTILVFYVSGHMFCYFNSDIFDAVTIKVDPIELVELKERYQAVGAPLNGNPKYWASVRLGMDLSDAQLLRLVEKSYELVKKTKRKQ